MNTLKLSILVILVLNLSGWGQSANLIEKFEKYRIHYDSIDVSQAKQITSWLQDGQQNIRSVFNKDFKRSFDIFIFSDRDSLDKQWQKDWNMPGFKSQCWMVASGIAHRLDILSPRVWQAQACEHDVRDTTATRKIVFHEMIHVFHGQHNPSPTFEHIDNIDWFVEGIAVYSSGQLDQSRYADAQDFLIKNEGPNTLSEIWKGENRYGLAGSIVKFIDDRYGRKVLFDMLAYTSATEMLNHLSISEKELLLLWKTAVRSNSSVQNKF
ncbi:MAG: hypothetical protein HKO90_02990 [Flavobacteriaceae bacterium]|nr:hypothetical protein [Flavobacteriaceae bacterium]